jgi:hypothetical protein
MGLVRQFFATRTNARPAREVVETLTIAIVWFGIVVVLRREGIERPIHRAFDSGHVFAVGVPVNVVRTRASHQFVGHVVDGDYVWCIVSYLWRPLQQSYYV